MQHGNRIEEREFEFIVGRERELQRFSELLEQSVTQPSVRLLHVYGIGGVGKSTFLRLCRRAAEQCDTLFLQLDSRDFSHNEYGFISAIYQQLGDTALPGEGLFKEFCKELERQSNERRIVLAMDTFEEMQDMERWLRERLFPMLPERTMILLAGRHPLKGGWLQSPAWRESIRQMELTHLQQNDCNQYLEKCGISNGITVERIWKQTKGHPLSLSLVAASHSLEEEAFSGAQNWFDELAASWLKEVPDIELRKHVEAASLLRMFDQERLSYVMEEEVSDDLFDRLTSLSFIRKSERGWQMHDLMRNSICETVKGRTPLRYQKLRNRCALYYAELILTASNRNKIEWEVGELFHYAGIDVVRALTTERDTSKYYFETITESTVPDVLEFERRRKSSFQAIKGEEIDPETGKVFRIQYTAEEVAYNYAFLEMEELYRLEPSSIWVLRDEEDQIHGLVTYIPFHEGTVPWLEKDPISSPYLNTLSEEERKCLYVQREQPAGWFFRSFDLKDDDILDPTIRTESIYLIYSFLLRGGLLVCSPFDSEIARSSYGGYGFTVVEGATHYHYDGKTPTPTYAIDTRGEKLEAFLEHLFKRSGLAWREPSLLPVTSDMATEMVPTLAQLLTHREQEVARLVIAGYSNAEVAAQLFVTEATVKKHLKSIFAKLGISRRIQLSGKLMGKE